jgi:hypothetical protein
MSRAEAVQEYQRRRVLIEIEAALEAARTKES